MFVRLVRRLCFPSLTICFVIPSILWALCLFILFMALSASASVIPGISSLFELDFIVLSEWLLWLLFGFRVICRSLCIFLEFLLCLIDFFQNLSSCSLLFVCICVY